MLVFTMVGVVVTMVLALVRACVGPTVYDRALAVNSFATVTVLLIALDGFYQRRPEFLDLALIYAMIGFLGTLAVLRFSKYGNLARDEQAKP
jgi:multicomponent Na+:H+ antiporter subunit F